MNTKLDIKKKLVEAHNLSVAPEEIGDDVDLFGESSSFGLDSMDVLLFINQLKLDFELSIDTINTESFKTVNNIVAFLDEQKAKTSN